MNRYAVPIVLIIGAVSLGLLRFEGILGFNATPLFVGLVALVAVAVGRKPRPWTSGIVITVWGIGVLLVREGPLPNREAAVFMVAAGLGLFIASVVESSARQADVAKAGAVAIAFGGALFYLAFDLAWLRSWWTFAAGLAVAALVEAGRSGTARS